MHKALTQALSAPLYRCRQGGGAAVEYIIVSTFATFIAIAGVTAVSKFLSKEVDQLKEKFGIEIDIDLNPFD